MIQIPRNLISSVAALFALYLIVLGAYAIDIPTHRGPVIAALVLFAVATVVSLLPVGPSRMPIWMAAFNLGTVLAMALAVSSTLDPGAGGFGYATWYVPASGVLLTITSTRRRYGFAWAGAVLLVAHTVAWAGPGALVFLGVVPSVAWVAISHLISVGMAKASQDAQRFSLAEREATEWQALQEAHVHERQFRLGQTNSMALSMLREIERSGGELTEAQRAECLHLEGAIRDEIRGRSLLNEAVRREVMVARRRGAKVTLLDEGGIDDLDGQQLSRVLNAVADAIALSSADKVIARTVPDDPETAVTVLGLKSVSRGTDVDDSENDEVEFWLEVPRNA